MGRLVAQDGMRGGYVIDVNDVSLRCSQSAATLDYPDRLESDVPVHKPPYAPGWYYVRWVVDLAASAGTWPDPVSAVWHPKYVSCVIDDAGVHHNVIEMELRSISMSGERWLTLPHSRVEVGAKLPDPKQGVKR
jgi:hypothetical protein